MDLQHLSQPQLTLTSQLPSQPHSFQKVRLQLSSKYHTIEFMVRLDITETEMSFDIEQQVGEGKQFEEIQEEGKHLIVGFGNVSSVGVQGEKVMVFLEDQNQQEQQEEQQSGNEQQAIIKSITPQYQNTSHPFPSIFKHLKLSQTCYVNLQGNYTLSLNFDTEQNRLKAHELLTNYLKSQQQSQQQQEFPLGQMISAEDINEDGTINKINSSGDEQQQQGEQQEENEKQN